MFKLEFRYPVKNYYSVKNRLTSCNGPKLAYINELLVFGKQQQF